MTTNGFGHFKKLIFVGFVLQLGAHGAQADVGGRQLLGPYDISMNYYEFTQGGGKAFQVLVDEHLVHGCRIDTYYKQSQLDANTWYVEIHDDPVGDSNCTKPKDIKVGSIVGYDFALKGSKTPLSLKLLINNLSQRKDIKLTVMSNSGDQVELVQDQLKNYDMYRIYDSIGDEFNGHLNYDLSSLNSCWQISATAKKLDFSFYQNGEIFPSDDFIVNVNAVTENKKPGACSVKKYSSTLNWEVILDPHPFRKAAVYVEKHPELDQVTELEIPPR